jgi:hypothetical protein
MTDIDNEVKLTIKLNNNQPVELNQLTAALNALGNQYDAFLKRSESFDYNKNQRKLYISKLESGSIYAELIPVVMETINQANSIIEFSSYLKNCYDYFLGTTRETKYILTKKDIVELSDIINPTANDYGSNLVIEVKGNNNTIINNIITVDSTKANAIQNGLNKKSADLIEDQPKQYSKVLMYWASANFNEKHDSNSGKVIIPEIDKKPKKVIFNNENDQILAMSSNIKFPNKNWQDLGYIVDVQVSYIHDNPNLYKITRLYGEDTYDPQDEN